MALGVAPVGGGILFMFGGASIGIALLAWTIYWMPRRFRATIPKSPRGWKRWLLLGAPLVAVMVCFPPRRRAGDWTNPATNQPLAAPATLEFDRFLFGYIPRYGWVGSQRREMPYDPPCEVTIFGRGPFRCNSYRWVIDGWFIVGEAAVLALLLLPFLRAGDGRSPLRTPHAPDRASL